MNAHLSLCIDANTIGCSAPSSVQASSTSSKCFYTFRTAFCKIYKYNQCNVFKEKKLTLTFPEGLTLGDRLFSFSIFKVYYQMIPSFP